MSNSSLDFFKSLIERDAKMAELLLKDTTPGPITFNKPYSSIKFVNDVLTIILEDGSIISKHPATIIDFQRARDSKSDAELFTVCSSMQVLDEKRKFEEQVARNKAMIEVAETLLKNNNFIFRDGSVYVRGISRSLPPMLVEEFAFILSKKNPLQKEDDNDEYQGLMNFWKWACLNPRAEVADKLFDFLKKNSFKITKQGFFAALRNVVTIHGGTELVAFVSETYNKVKAVWKKSPDNYTVFLEDGVYSIVHEDDLYEEETHTSTTCPDCLGEGVYDDYDNDDDESFCETCDGTGEVEEYSYTKKWSVNHGERIGILTELYLDLPNRAENRFTDAHTGKFDIRIGRAVSMPQEECTWNTDNCGASGLHFTSDEIHYVGCGDTSVLVLINPMKVVGIGDSKGRCYEYLPIMTVPREEATSLLHDLDFDTLQLDDNYAIQELSNLKERVHADFAAEAKKYSVNFPSISINEVDDIITSLNLMKESIKDRVKNV